MNDAGGTTPTQPFGQPVEPPEEEGGGESFASRLALAQRAGGLVAPLLTVEPHKRIATVWVFSASVKPAVDGIRVQLQRRVGKKWTKDQKAVTKRGVFEFTLSVPAGSSKWRLVSLDSANYAAAVSQVRTVSG